MRTKPLSIYVTVVVVIAVVIRGGGATAGKQKEEAHEENGNLRQTAGNGEPLQYVEVERRARSEENGGNQEGGRVLNGNGVKEDVDKGRLRSERLFRRSLREDSASAVQTPAKGLGFAWGVPSMATVTGWASGAYSSLPSRATVSAYVPAAQTITSYLPGAWQPYLPSADTLQSYLPSAATIKEYLPSATQYLSEKYLGVANSTRLLTKNDTDKLVDAMSGNILHGEKGANLTIILEGIGQNVTQRAVGRATPALLRAVVRKVVYGMAVASVGPALAYFAQNKITQVADAVADRAVAQWQKSYSVFKVDVFTYLRNMRWTEISKGVVQVVRRTFGTAPAEAEQPKR